MSMEIYCDRCGQTMIREELEDSEHMAFCEKHFGQKICFECFSEMDREEAEKEPSHFGSMKAFCIECGCDDDHACPEGCRWLRVDYSAGLGVCSECESRTGDWDAGDRTLSEEARLTLEFMKEGEHV